MDRNLTGFLKKNDIFFHIPTNTELKTISFLSENDVLVPVFIELPPTFAGSVHRSNNFLPKPNIFVSVPDSFVSVTGSFVSMPDSFVSVPDGFVSANVSSVSVTEISLLIIVLCMLNSYRYLSELIPCVLRFVPLGCKNAMKHLRIALIFLLAIGFLFTLHTNVSAKDEWIQVKSKNFFLIGNASEKDIRKVGTRLEQFRETFRNIFRGMVLTASIPTNVVVFKSDSSYKTFKPKRADGKIDDFIAGYFQGGEDVNYITLSVEGEDAQTFETIFHEYVHFIIDTTFGKSEIPPWFNEGLAEYYSTFAIAEDQKVKLGLPISGHIMRLRDTKLMPLTQLFGISNSQLLQTGDHSRSIVYSESWALIHYLIQGGKTAALDSFLNMMVKDVPVEKAVPDAFGMSVPDLEAALRKYVGLNSFKYVELTFKQKLLFDQDMIVSPLKEDESNAYLGDLLFHIHRVDDAEPYLAAAIKLNPDSGPANTSLGMVKIRQRKWNDARVFLEKAIASDSKNHSALFQYAYLLSREGMDEFGYVQKFNEITAAKMRDALSKAIALKPSFTESYELLAFVNLVNNEHLEDSANLMRQALKYQPGSQRYLIRLAELLFRLDKLDEATAMAEKLARTAENGDIKGRGESLIEKIGQKKDYDKMVAERVKQNGVPPRNPNVTSTGETIAIEDPDANLRSINQAMRKALPGEQRVIGSVQKIDCRAVPILYTIKAGTETFLLKTQDFQSLTLNDFAVDLVDGQVGCDSNLSKYNAVITFAPKPSTKPVAKGELVAIEFVPQDFRFIEGDFVPPKLIKRPSIQQNGTGSNESESIPVKPDDVEAMRRAAMMKHISDNLKKPIAGQKREIGFLDKVECKNNVAVFILRTPTATLRLANTNPGSMSITLFVQDLNGVQFGCSLTPVEFPVVFVYTDAPDQKKKTAGEIISMDFVPKSFVLEP